MTRTRLDRLVPEIMQTAGIDCWVLVSREYAEDMVARSMEPAAWMSSRRRTILLFLRDGDRVTRVAVARYELPGLFESGWDPARDPDQWDALARLIGEADPTTIAVSSSEWFAHADGLTASERDRLIAGLGPDLANRVVSGEVLAVRWLHTRLEEEKPVLTEACTVAHDILRRALSREAIDPGTTTTADVEWWLRAQVQSIGCDSWFHPSCSVQRPGSDLRGPLSSATTSVVIEPGDLVHIDFGLVWDHLCTDQQQHGYVLREGESRPPQGLVSAMERANRLQDILISNFQTGRTGNDVLAESLSGARHEGLDPLIYTHPIGYQGHGAGPTIGLWDQQDGVAGAGDVELFGPSAWAIELMCRSNVPEFGSEPVAIMLEEQGWFEGEVVEWVDGRQTEIWTI